MQLKTPKNISRKWLNIYEEYMLVPILFPLDFSGFLYSSIEKNLCWPYLTVYLSRLRYQSHCLSKTPDSNDNLHFIYLEKSKGKPFRVFYIQVLYICDGTCIRIVLKEGVESPTVIVPPGPCGECPHTLTVVRIFPTRGRPDVGRIPPWGVD